MHYLILIAIVIGIIYGLIKLIIFLAPYIGIGLLFILGAGGVVGLLVGTFYGIKNYMSSINEKINNKAFKVIMIIITSIIIIIILFYLIAITYYLFGYFN